MVGELLEDEPTESAVEPHENEVAPAPVASVIEAPSAPPSASGVILGIKVDGESFLSWALDETVKFLDLADLDRMATVSAFRKTKEEKIRDKIQVANSMLVLLANYGSEKDDEQLVKACEVYAAKMKTIIQRLGL